LVRRCCGNDLPGDNRFLIIDDGCEINVWIDQLPTMRLETRKRTLFIDSHEPAVAYHAGGEDSCQPTFSARVRQPKTCLPSTQSLAQVRGSVHREVHREGVPDARRIKAPNWPADKIDI
jgi:hypothetical protein